MKIVEINKLFSQEWKSNGIIWNDTFFKKNLSYRNGLYWEENYFKWIIF